MRVLVTGQGGFTGRYLVDALAAAGHDVLPFDVDITDPIAVAHSIRDLRPDGIIHLAARAFIQSDAVMSFYEVNQIGTFHLLEAAANHVPGAPVLVASSANIYGNAASGFLTEETPPDPVNHYAVSKLAMEFGAWLWADRVPLTVVRPFNYTGRGQENRYIIAKIVDHFVRRVPVIELGNLDIQRDFGDVRSVVNAYVGLLDRRHSGTFNICTGQLTSLHDVIALCVELTDHHPEVEVNEAFVRKNDVAILAGDPTRLQAALPQWRSVPLRETLAWMLGDAVDGRHSVAMHQS
jgi:nucleoside-diphosphate-sugar epimerase